MRLRLSLLVIWGATGFAQNSPFQQWAENKRAAAAANLILRAQRTLAAAEAGSTSTAASAPSVDSSSSAVVDRSNPGEFFNAALNLAGTNGQPTASNPMGSVTVTVYSLVAALQHQSLFDPELYQRNRFLRRVSFTIGTAASNLNKDGTETPAALYGFRWRLFEGPDLFSTARNGLGTVQQTVLANLQARLNTNSAFSSLNAFMLQLATAQFGTAAVLTLTPSQFDQVYASASAADRANIDRLLAAWGSEDTQLEQTVLDLREHLKRPRQLSIAYFTNQRSNGGADDHRVELIYEWGVHPLVDWTTNGGFEYRNVMNLGGDRGGGRLASEAKIRLFEVSAPGATAEQWVSLDLGGEWKAMTGVKSYIKGQVRLTIPLTSGVSLPLAWSYESRPALTPATQSNDSFRKFRFSIEFDPAKITGLVR